MPDNVISIRVVVKDDGSIALKQVAQSTEDLGKKAAAGSEGMVKLNATAAEARGIFQGLGQEGAGLLGRFSGLLTVLGPVGIGLGAAAYAAHSAVSEFTTFATKVRDLSFLAGGSTRDTSILISGLEAVGVSSENVETGIRMMSAAIENGSPAINRLGISMRDASGQQKNALVLFYESIDALRGVTNELERNKLARDLFGRSWTEMLPVLQRGADAIRKLGEESGKFITPADLAMLQEYRQAVHDLEEEWERAKINMGRGLIVPITWLVKTIGARPSGERTWEEQAAGLAPPYVVSPYSDVGAAGFMGSGRVGGAPTPGKNIQELQREAFAAQTAQMQAAAAALIAMDPVAILSAQADALRASLRAELAKFELEAKSQGLTDDQIAQCRIALTAQTNAAIEKLTRDSSLRQAEAVTKYYADITAMSEKQFNLRVKIEQDITGATLNENDKRLREVQTWEEANVKAIQSVYGEGTAVYSEGGRRRVEIERETARKIHDALVGQTDAFEEAYRLQAGAISESLIREQGGRQQIWEQDREDVEDWSDWLDTWREANLKSIQSVNESIREETTESVDLITAVYAEGGRRRVEIERDIARKIHDALVGQTDEFEEAYRLMGQPVTLDWDRYYVGFLKEFSEAKQKFQNALTAPIEMRALSLGGPQFLPFAEYEDRLTKIGITAQLIGRQYFDSLSESINATQSALQALVANGVDPADERMQELKESLTGLQDQFERREMFRGMFDGISSGITDSVRGVIQRTRTMGQAWRNMAQSIALSIENVIINGALKKLEREMERVLFPPGAGGGGLLGILGNLFGFGGDLTAATAPAFSYLQTGEAAEFMSIGGGFAWSGSGNILPGTFAPLRRFAWGGISDGPMLGMIGKGPYRREAVIPMPDGRFVPVSFTGPAASATPQVIINVNNQSGVPLDFKQTGMRRDQDKVIIEVVTKNLWTNPDFRALVAAVR